MTRYPTYQTILDAERAFIVTRDNYQFHYAIIGFLAAAEDNASDDQGRIDSIISLLSHPSPDRTPDVIAWFAKLGIVA